MAKFPDLFVMSHKIVDVTEYMKRLMDENRILKACSFRYDGKDVYPLTLEDVFPGGLYRFEKYIFTLVRNAGSFYKMFSLVTFNGEQAFCINVSNESILTLLPYSGDTIFPQKSLLAHFNKRGVIRIGSLV